MVVYFLSVSFFLALDSRFYLIAAMMIQFDYRCIFFCAIIVFTSAKEKDNSFKTDFPAMFLLGFPSSLSSRRDDRTSHTRMQMCRNSKDAILKNIHEHIEDYEFNETRTKRDPHYMENLVKGMHPLCELCQRAKEILYRSFSCSKQQQCVNGPSQ